MDNKNIEEPTQEKKEGLLNNKNNNTMTMKIENKTKRRTSTIILVIIIISLVLLSLIGVGINLMEKHKLKDDVKKPSNDNELIDGTSSTSIKTEKYYFYKDPHSYYFQYTLEDGSFYDDYTKLGSYTCYDSNDCKIYSFADNYAVLRDYADIYLYNVKENKKEKLDLEYNDYDSISVLAYDGVLYGLSLKKTFEEKSSFYNYEQKKELVVGEYDDIASDNYYYREYQGYSSALKQGYIVGVNNEELSERKSSLINLKTGEVVFNVDGATIGVITNNGHTYYYVNYSEFEDTFDANIYNDELEPIAPGKRFSQLSVLDNGNIACSDSKTYYIYDKSGTLVKNGGSFKLFGKLMKDYIAIVDSDNYLKLIDYDGKEVVKFTNFTDNYVFHEPVSGWGTEDGKYGVYLAVENKDVEETVKGSGLLFYYIPETKEQGVIENEGVDGYGKPVLYLYPTKDNTKVTVDFSKENLLTTTYPKFKNYWTVTANKNGDLYDQNGNYYYGLYWEEQGTTHVDFTTGFYVTRDNAISFLEEKLSIIGLNDKERNEFIMYWLPILEKNEKNLVYFELTEERQSYNELIINPTPDSLLRVAIHVKKVNRKTSIKEEKLIKFNRKGFTAVEWGGVVH